ncbi:MAG TPA: hypothetical protein VNZ64_09780 [Candidatus Acidoferrum sp.]|jgi:hypothetical protein|nr:hypothetical protein [Candidatus Acidoferrum sp.]
MCRVRIALAVLIAASLRIQAQDALRSALSLDPALAPRESSPVGLQPSEPHLGPVPFSLAAYIGVTYDDNFFESESNPQSDMILRGGLTVSVRWLATERSELRFSTDIGYLHYVTHSQDSGFQVSPNSALTYSVSYADATVSFYDQFNYWREVTTESALANIAILPRLDNTIGARLSWEPGRWLAQVGYGHESFLSDNAANNYLDRSTENLFSRFGWRLAEKSETGLEASGSFTSYRVHLQSDNRSLSIGPYADWQLRPAIHLALRGGPTVYFFDPNGTARGSANLNSYYLGLELSHQLTDYLAYQLNLRRDVQLGLNQGSDYIEQLSIASSLSCAVTRRITIGASLTYENGSQPLPVLVIGPYVFKATEHFDRLGGGPQFSWRFTDRLNASVSYFHWQRASDLPGRGYAENTVSLSLGYTF